MSKRIDKKKTNENKKRELLNSLQNNDDVEKQGLNETVKNVNNSRSNTYNSLPQGHY